MQQELLASPLVADPAHLCRAAVVGTNRKDMFRTAESGLTYPAGGTRAVVSLSKTF